MIKTVSLGECLTITSQIRIDSLYLRYLIDMGRILSTALWLIIVFLYVLLQPAPLNINIYRTYSNREQRMQNKRNFLTIKHKKRNIIHTLTDPS